MALGTHFDFWFLFGSLENDKEKWESFLGSPFVRVALSFIV